MGLETLALVSAVATVGGTALSYSNQRKGQKEQEKQQAAASRKERMQAIRQAQMQRAQAVMSSVGQGTSDSSGASGGIGSISSQLGTEMGFGSQMTALSKNISKFGNRAGMWEGVAGIGSSVFSMTNGPSWLSNKMGGGSVAPAFEGYPDPKPRQRSV